MRSLRYLNMILTVLCVLVALQLWTVWTGWGSAAASTAMAQAVPGNGIPDAGSQRKEIIDALKHLSQQTDDLNGFLKSGQFRAHIDMSATH